MKHLCNTLNISKIFYFILFQFCLFVLFVCLFAALFAFDVITLSISRKRSWPSSYTQHTELQFLKMD